jgi:carbonic anhydrase
MTYQKRTAITVTLLTVLIFILSACSGDSPIISQPTAAAVVDELAEAVESVGEEAAEPEHEIHWSYEGEGGPAHWSELDPVANVDCAAGQEQSPINITNAEPKDLTNIVFHYLETKVNIENNGHTIQLTYDSGSSIEVERVVSATEVVDLAAYTLKQFHFHAPSEHAIKGQLADAEMHLVHYNADDKPAVVVGLLIYSGAENTLFAPIWEYLPDKKSDVETIPGLMLNAADLIPADSTFYTYPGSLTTPPCTQGITWLVLTTPIEMSAKQIEDLEEAMIGEFNNRPLQELNDRDLLEDSSVE